MCLCGKNLKVLTNAHIDARFCLYYARFQKSATILSVFLPKLREYEQDLHIFDRLFGIFMPILSKWQPPLRF